MSYDPLRGELIKLAADLRPHGISLIVGGGYGLYLRTEHILKSGAVTRFDETPEARSTDDLDFLLSLEIVTDAMKMGVIRDAISKGGYKPVAEYFQFAKAITVGSEDLSVKIDLLAQRPASPDDLKKVKIKEMRIRPRDAEKIHAYVTDEAITLTEGLSPISLSESDTVFLPHPFTYLLLKLFALRDHIQKADKSKAPEHAADVYRTVGMMTENEWNESKAYSKKYTGDPIMTVASAIVAGLYSDPDAAGPLETYKKLGRGDRVLANIEKVLEDLGTLFPA